MDIIISENLKQYRKVKGNTQEELAEHLGISIQAVSKWERNEGFPDITLLPQIAMYYDVSVDDLLGVGKIQIEKKVAEYLKQSDAYGRKGEVDKVVSLWAKAMKEFPNNYRVLDSYMDTLPTERSEEIIKIAELLYNESDVASHRYNAIWRLIHLYRELGNEDKAIECALRLPRAEISRDHMLTKIYKGEKLVKCVQENVSELVQLIDDQIYRMVWHGDLNRDEQRKARQYCLKIYNWLYEDGDYGYYVTKVANIYADLAILDALDENIDGVVTNLSLMADCEIKLVTQRGFQHTSFLINRTFHEDGFQGYSNSPENACRWAINFMKRHWFEFCKEDERLKEIEKRLLEYAN